MKASPAQWKYASRSPGARVVRAPTMNRSLASSNALRFDADSIPAPVDDDELADAVSGLEGLHRGGDRGGLGPVAFPAAYLEGGNLWRSTSRPTMTWGSTFLSLPVTHLPQVVLSRPRSRAWSRLQVQGQSPGGGDVLEQGLGDRLAVAPLHAVSQGAEQGPHANRLQVQVIQHVGDLGLGGRLDQTRQNHLLKSSITTSGVSQPQVGRPRAGSPTARTSAWTPPWCWPGRFVQVLFPGTPGPAAPGPTWRRSSAAWPPARPPTRPRRGLNPVVPQSGAELAACDHIAVYPVGGWWKNNNRRDRRDLPVRYALLVSLSTSAQGADLYTPIAAQLSVPVTAVPIEV